MLRDVAHGLITAKARKILSVSLLGLNQCRIFDVVAFFVAHVSCILTLRSDCVLTISVRVTIASSHRLIAMFHCNS